uniref:Uncharacterized protein n=1 Tax=Arundo donax TaxID=35708 RepID=A0A0A9GFE5_ARUDO
MAGLYRSSAR